MQQPTDIGVTGKMTKVAGYEIHPACLAMPEMSDEEFAALRADMKNHGQLCPIEVHKGKVIDGRHRLRACKELRLDPWTVETQCNDMEPTAYVVSLNFARRHLTASQRAAIAADLLPAFEAEAKERKVENLQKGREIPVPVNLPEREKGDSRAKAAEIVGVSPKQVSDAKKIKEADPEVFADMKAGKTTVNAAKKKISGGTSFDPEEIEAASPPPAKAKPKNGRPTISTAGRKAASVSLGQLIRALEAIGLYEQFEPALSQIAERLRKV